MTLLYLADRDASYRGALAMRLRRRGARVVEFSSGSELCRASEAQPADLVVMDPDLEGTHGFQVFAELRGRARGSGPGVVFVARFENVGVAEGCRQRGALDYIGKSRSPEQVADRLLELAAARSGESSGLGATTETEGKRRPARAGRASVSAGKVSAAAARDGAAPGKARAPAARDGAAAAKVPAPRRSGDATLTPSSALPPRVRAAALGLLVVALPLGIAAILYGSLKGDHGRSSPLTTTAARGSGGPSMGELAAAVPRASEAAAPATERDPARARAAETAVAPPPAPEAETPAPPSKGAAETATAPERALAVEPGAPPPAKETELDSGRTDADEQAGGPGSDHPADEGERSASSDRASSGERRTSAREPDPPLAPPSLLGPRRASRALVDHRSGELVVIVPWSDQDLLPPGQNAHATLEVEVDEGGEVAALGILASTGVPALDARAIAAVRNLVYRPASREGRPVPARTLQQVILLRE